MLCFRSLHSTFAIPDALQYGQRWARAFTSLPQISNVTCLATPQTPIQTFSTCLITALSIVRNMRWSDMSCVCLKRSLIWSEDAARYREHSIDSRAYRPAVDVCGGTIAAMAKVCSMHATSLIRKGKAYVPPSYHLVRRSFIALFFFLFLI